jgi:hypothetical protein
MFLNGLRSFRCHSFIAPLGIFLFTLPVILLYLFDYTVLSLLTQFGSPFAWLLGWLIFGYGLLISLFYAIGYWKIYQWLVVLPFVVLLGVMILTRVLPFRDWSFQLEFSLKHHARLAAIEYIREHVFKEDTVDQVVRLPANYQYLSSGGGDVVVRKKSESQLSVMFYLWRGILDTSSGLFVYTSDDALPSTYIGYSVSEKRIADSWYFVIWR